MPHAAKSPATVNADFATAIIIRASEIVAGAAADQGDNPNAFEALQKARDEFVAGHLHRDEKGRTYGWPQLVNDLRRYLEAHGIVAPGTWGNITRWSTATNHNQVARILRGCLKRVQLVWTHEGREGGVGRSVGVWNDQLIPATSATENGNCWNPCYLRPSRVVGRSPTRDGRSSTPSATCCAPAAPGGCGPMTCRRGALCSITSAPGVGTELGSGPATRCTPCCGRLRAGRPAPARPSSTASR